MEEMTGFQYWKDIFDIYLYRYIDEPDFMMNEIMRNKKKIVIIVVSIILVLALITAGAIVLYTKVFKFNNPEKIKRFDEPTVYVGTAEGKLGDTVKIPVYISKNPGFMAFLFDIEYDEQSLEYVSYTAGDMLNDFNLNHIGNGKIKMMDLENSDIDKDGKLVELKFKIIKDNVSKAEIEVDISDDSFCNFDEKFLDIDDEDGFVKINK